MTVGPPIPVSPANDPPALAVTVDLAAMVAAEGLGKDWPADAKVLLPLLAADTAAVRVDLKPDDAIAVELRLTAADPAKAAACVKALKAAVQVVATVAAVTAAEPGKQFGMTDGLRGGGPVAKALGPVAKAATVTADGPAAVLAVTLPADFPLAAVFAGLINLRSAATGTRW